MKFTIQLLQNYLLQETPSIIISTENTKYIFNVPSTFQRFIKDHRIKFPKGANYFFTKSSSSTMAGLNGFMLTIFESGAMDSKLYLNEKMFDYMEDTRYKMGFKMLPFSYCQWNGQRFREGVKDPQTIKNLIAREDFADIFDDLDQYLRKEFKPQDINSAMQNYDQLYKGFRDQFVTIVPFHIESNNQLITNYVCISRDLPGKVLNQKIKQLGIPPKFIGRILQAQSFQLPGTEKIIKRQQIQQKDQPGPAIFILHINSIQAVKGIVIDKTFMQWVKNKRNPIESVVYIVESRDLVVSQEFKQLVKFFPANSCEHMVYAAGIVDQQFRADTFIKPHMQIVSKLGRRFQKFGCMPDLIKIHQQSVKKYIQSGFSLQKIFSQISKNVHVMMRNDELVLVPTKNKGYKPFIGKLQTQSLKEFPQIENKLLQKFLLEGNKKSNKQMQQQLPFNSESLDPKIIFLGTGSMKPSTYRNVSSILLQMNSENSFLLDCGQSSLYQMSNHYPLQKSDQHLLNVRVIFITHIHSDHNLGILDLISRRNKLMKFEKDPRKLFLVIPCNVYPWYRSFLDHIQDLSQGCSLLFIQALRGQQFTLGDATMSKDERVTCPKSDDQMDVEQHVTAIKKQKSEGQHQNQQAPVKTKKYLYKTEQMMKLFQQQSKIQSDTLKQFRVYLEQIGVSSFNPVPVIHCPQSYGIVIQHQKSGFKLAYSGDTRPAEEFTKASLNSTFLIHEATFGDELVENAINNFHSTVGQAMQVGMKANCWKTALTHFSQRYVSARQICDPKNYNMQKDIQQYLLQHTIICYDHLEIRAKQASHLPSVTQWIAKSIDSEQ